MTDEDLKARALETRSRTDKLLLRVNYHGHSWRTGILGNGAYLQIIYWDPDVNAPVGAEAREQHGRKWYISPHATSSEILQTALKAAITSAEHRVREHFLVDSVRAFGPHLDVDEFVEFARSRSENVRR